VREPGGLPGSVDGVLELLGREHYVADRALSTAVHLSLTLGRPLLLEGEAGVGKTEVAKVLASGLERRLIRLQCYEGLDVASAVYEWNFARQMIAIRIAEASGGADRDSLERDLFSEAFLIRRPLLEAIQPGEGPPPVLLIDEIDRADDPFEAFLLELLSDFQITVPELGTLTALDPPIVIITSNRTREIHDALRRRCFYHWLDYPDAEREFQIVRVRVPDAAGSLLRQVVAFVQRLREMELFKVPGIAESIDWTRALMALGTEDLEASTIDETLGVLLKYEDDVTRVRGEPARNALQEVVVELAGAPSE
jgi:MoxR-like ATPase